VQIYDCDVQSGVILRYVGGLVRCRPLRTDLERTNIAYDDQSLHAVLHALHD